MHVAIHTSSGDADAVIRRCRQVGVNQVCLGLQDAPGFAETGVPDRAYLRGVVGRLADAGIAAEVAMVWFGNGLGTVLDPGAHRGEIDLKRRLLATLGDVGIGTLLHYVNLAAPEHPSDEARCRDGLVAVFRKLVTEAESSNVRIANHAIWRCLPDPLREAALPQGVTMADYRGYRRPGWDGPYLLASHRDVAWLIEAVPSSHNGVCFCTGMHIMGGDVPALAEAFRGKIYFSQLRDLRGHWPAAQEVFLGEGELDFSRILRSLKLAGYTGLLGPEHLGKPRSPGDDLERRAVDFVRQKLVALEGGDSSRLHEVRVDVDGGYRR